jgi:hypothetical protein
MPIAPNVFSGVEGNIQDIGIRPVVPQRVVEKNVFREEFEVQVSEGGLDILSSNLRADLP